MSETNPYSAPQTDVYANHTITSKFQGLDFKQLKKLYYRSSNVNAITFLLGLGLIGLAIVLILPNSAFEPSMKLFFVGLAVFYAVAVVGLFKRTAWGRIIGIIVCIISLINVPIGTAIGVFGLFAFLGAPKLFGSNRITHRELKSEFKLQKARMKRG
jgi:ABC-type antimicrobial peptide transport system permease subunit